MQTQALLKGTPIRGRYQLEARIGQGGMGSVYRATDLFTGQPVALKQVRYDRFQRNKSVERFRREGETLARLDHPNIVRVVELLFDGDSDLIVMEFVPGGSLADLLATKPAPLPLERVLELAFDLCDAITRCHRLGVIHRDLKPSNVLIAEDGSPKLTDFGVAHIQGQKRLTDTPTLVGTTEYLSPEALRGDEVDARADIWSFGVLLFELLTSQHPFAGRTVADVLHAITFNEPPELATLRPDCPRGLVELVRGMLAKDRAQRIPSLRQVSAALDDVSRRLRSPALRTGDGASHSTPVSSSGAPSSWRNALRARGRGVFPSNVPVATATFVGRDGELCELETLLKSSSAGLVTLVGPGGIGKTRLSLELAQRLVAEAELGRGDAALRWPDGIYWIPVATLASSELVASAIAVALGVRFKPHERAEDQLLAHLCNKKLLLFIDNFEHLTRAADTLNALLAAATGVRVLVTSRERLGLGIEAVVPLGALDSPEPCTRGNLTASSAVRLFLQCARQQRPNFALTPGCTEQIARVCRLVEGLPLGIVLAASWAGCLSPREIADELDHGLDWNASEWREVPERQRSARAVFEHSWSLLHERDRVALAALAVFRRRVTRQAQGLS